MADINTTDTTATPPTAAPEAAPVPITTEEYKLLMKLRTEKKEKEEKKRNAPLRLAISDKTGALMVQGLQRFPVTLYKEQWIRLLKQGEAILKFISENESKLSTKTDAAE